jgi:type II secretory pathway pseudopilin PulG
MFKFKARNHQAGDTIIEVLIAVAVVTSVLGIVYSTMNRNLTTIRRNQEKTEASKMAQSQIESLKGLYSVSPDTITNEANNGFCINGATVVAIPTKPSGTLNGDDLTTYSTCVSNFLRYVIKRDSTDTKLYSVTVRYDAFNGGRNEVKMYYRIP